MILTVIMEGISKASTVLSALMKGYNIPCHDRSDVNIMMVLQICTDPLHIMPSSSSDTYAALSDCVYHVLYMKAEDFEMQGEEGEVNVKTEKGIGSEEEDSIGIKDEEGINSEEEEDIDGKGEEDIGIREEVSLQGTV